MSPSCWCWCCCCCLIAFCSVIVISSPTSSSPHTQKKEAAVPHPNYCLNTQPLPFSLPPARSAPHQKHDRKKVDTQTLPQPQLSRQARCCRKGNNDKLTLILQTLILQIRNIIMIIIRRQTHQRVRTVAHSQKLPTRVRSCRSRHASRCIPSTSMRRVDSGVTPARRRRRRPDPPLKLHQRVSFLFLCRCVGSRALARAVGTILVPPNGDGDEALVVVVVVVHARPDFPTSVPASARPTETKRACRSFWDQRNADRWTQSLHRPLDLDYNSPTAGRRVTVIGKYVGGQNNENKSLAVLPTRSNLCTYVFHNRTYVFIMFVRTLT